jgi:nucleoid-associated protein YgaU
MNKENPGRKVTNSDFDPEVKLNHFGEPAFIQPNSTVQARLKMGKANDKYEKEADNVADKVVSQAKTNGEKSAKLGADSSIQKQEEKDNGIQAKPIGETITPLVQKMETEGEEVQQKKNEGGINNPANIEGSLNSSKGGGSKMDSETTSQMESGFGRDFSDVNIHTDSNAVQMSEDIGAKAFTNGNDVYFNKGQYNPSSKEGKHLLAHELTHTVQQGANSGNVQKSNLIQRDIIGTGNVDHGAFDINMIKKEMPPEPKAGVKGVIKFTPNSKSPNTNDIALIQIIKVTDFMKTPKSDFIWPGGDSDRNNVVTTASSKSYTTKADETLKSISKSQTNRDITAWEIYKVNKIVLGKYDANKKIPTNTKLKVPVVQKGYSVDHNPVDSKAVPKANASDSDVPLSYRDYWPNSSVSQDGHKKSKTDLKHASLWDFPGLNSNSYDVKFDFETVARSRDKGFDFGTLHWGMKIKSGKISGEYYRSVPGTSSTFRSSIAEFNAFYKNHHTVMKGETLFKLAKLYYGNGSKLTEIQKANKLKDTAIIPGQKLIIPKITKQ